MLGIIPVLCMSCDLFRIYLVSTVKSDSHFLFIIWDIFCYGSKFYITYCIRLTTVNHQRLFQIVMAKRMTQAFKKDRRRNTLAFAVSLFEEQFFINYLETSISLHIVDL